jgi:hypothetical protein
MALPEFGRRIWGASKLSFSTVDHLRWRHPAPVLSKYLFEIIGGWAGHDKFRADLERSLPILRSCYFIATQLISFIFL